MKMEDGSPIPEKLSVGSHKNIYFNCDVCGIEVLQSYRNYNKQKNGHYCRRCRNKHTANLSSVKEKQSIASKKKWMDVDYRIMMSEKLSVACKNAWDNDTGDRRQRLSDNNPMFDVDVTRKVQQKMRTLEMDIHQMLSEVGYTYVGRKGKAHIEYICDKGHHRTVQLNHFVSGCRCGDCCRNFSQAEIEISKLFSDEIILNNRNIIFPRELDIYIPSKNIAIEYCGLFWHGEKMGKGKKYHYSKMMECQEKGIQLITIFEDEWINKKEIVKNRLNHIIGNNKDKIYARKCIVSEISTELATQFINTYHIQEYGNSAVKLGAFYDDECVAVMTFSKANIAKGRKSLPGLWELNRFCTSKNVIGIAGKLLEYFKKHYHWNEIYSYADRRWSVGNLYEKLGFTKNIETPPNYWYYKLPSLERHHRFNFRKDKIQHLGEGTEWDIMKFQGYDRIWDCGSLKYTLLS